MKKTTTLLISLVTFLAANELTRAYPEDEIGHIIKLGEDIIRNTDTHPLTKDLVGNRLKCVSCHLAGSDGQAGMSKTMGTFNGIATKFPSYIKREKVVETLQDRIDDCFMRSMDGIHPIIDSEASMAMLTYVTWLSSGQAIDLNPRTSHILDFSKKVNKFTALQRKARHKNYLNGQSIFKNKCSACHGDKGEGVATFPPLWGKDAQGKWLSYNAGAGMSKIDKSAAWIQSNMPLGQGSTLDDQESADVALYINAQDRNSFDLRKKLSEVKNMAYYNSKVLKEIDTVESNFQKFGLRLKDIRGE